MRGFNSILFLKWFSSWEFFGCVFDFREATQGGRILQETGEAP